MAEFIKSLQHTKSSFLLQNVTWRMRSKPGIQSDVGNVVTELCTRREQKEVSFPLESKF